MVFLSGNRRVFYACFYKLFVISSSFYKHFHFVLVIKIGTIVPLHKVELFNERQFLDNQIIYL